MQTIVLIIVILGLTFIGFRIGRHRSLAMVNGAASRLHSLPDHYGYFVALWCGIPAIVLMIFWLILEPVLLNWLVISILPIEITDQLSHSDFTLLLNDIRNIAAGDITTKHDDMVTSIATRYTSWQNLSLATRSVFVLVLAISSLAYGRRLISPNMRARNHVEKVVQLLMVICSMLAILTTIGIVLSLLFESFRFFSKVPLTEFLFGLEWSPQIAIREGQVGSSGSFGAVPLFVGTLLISFIAMVVAVPLGLLAAIYMSEYANRATRDAVKPILEILAGIPTVVYGFFAALSVAPFFREQGIRLGLDISSESALTAGIVMGIMIIPFVSSLSDDAIAAVPQSQRDGSYALGGTRSETIRKVVFPAALPGIVGGVLLAVSRAIGETMIVVMAAGLSANLTANPFEAVTTVTVQIVSLLVGDQEFDSPKTLAAFALGLMLFCITLLLNIIALHVVRKYREQYE